MAMYLLVEEIKPTTGSLIPQDNYDNWGGYSPEELNERMDMDPFLGNVLFDGERVQGDMFGFSHVKFENGQNLIGHLFWPGSNCIYIINDE